MDLIFSTRVCGGAEVPGENFGQCKLFGIHQS